MVLLKKICRKLKKIERDLLKMCRKKYVIISTAYDKKGSVISVGKNQYNKSNTWQKELSVACGLNEDRIYIHSEVDALIKARNLRKQVHTMKIERFDYEGKPKLAFPCISCQLALKLSGVKKVIFTSEDGYSVWIP